MKHSRTLSRILIAAGAFIVGPFTARADALFNIDFETATAEEPVLVESATPGELPGTSLTSASKNVTFTVKESGTLPGKFGLCSTQKGDFALKWSAGGDERAVKSGKLTVKWTMVIDPKSPGSATFQILRADVPEGAGKRGNRLARIHIAEDGVVKIGGSTASGSADDYSVHATISPGEPHQCTWTIDFDAGTQSLAVDGGKAVDFSSATSPRQNVFTGAPAVAFEVDLRDSAIAFDDIAISTDA